MITYIAATGYLIVSDTQNSPFLQPLAWGTAMKSGHRSTRRPSLARCTANSQPQLSR